MAWVRTSDILDLSKEFFRQMHLLAEGLDDPNDIQRMGILLGAVERHVEYLEKNFHVLEKETSPEILDARFQFSYDQPQLTIDPTKRIRPGMTIDDLADITIDFDSALAEFYQRIADANECEAVRKLFLNLKNSIEKEKKKLALEISSLNRKPYN